MIKYTPFLKLKQNEIGALRELHGDVIEFIKPLFDLPRTSRKQSEKEIAKRIEMAFKCMEKLDKENKLEFYLDNFDLDDDIKIKGIDQYHFILAKFDRFSPIPV